MTDTAPTTAPEEMAPPAPPPNMSAVAALSGREDGGERSLDQRTGVGIHLTGDERLAAKCLGGHRARTCHRVRLRNHRHEHVLHEHF